MGEAARLFKWLGDFLRAEFRSHHPGPPLFRKADWLCFGLTTLLVFIGYMLTLAPDLTLEDSGELAVGSFYAGVPHPPGYPVWTIYTWLFTLLPISNIAFRVGLSSAVAAAFACGIVALPSLGVTSVQDLWTVAAEKIWKGGEPLRGGTKFTFWHVVFFAWFCNAAMHLGMADMSILRYARRSRHGSASAAGMFVGHYVAWISASLLFARQLQRDPLNDTVAPGPMAFEAVGVAGLICVVIAGWTTANPTIYRAGLAFQGITRRATRVGATLVAGGIATVGALFPGVVMRLMDFVGLYGTILMPMGAIIAAEHFLFPKLGLAREFSRGAGGTMNLAAGFSWGLSLLVSAILFFGFGFQIYFLALPGWVIAGVLYVLLTLAREKAAHRMMATHAGRL